MDKLTIIHSTSLDLTKYKIEEDIQQYFETKEDLPTFAEYMEDRKHYVEQIWYNVWLNKVTNDVARKEKKHILSECGFETEGVDKKIINQLFKNEMREYEPFHAVEWLRQSSYTNPSVWAEKYIQARKDFQKRMEEKRLQLRMDAVTDKVDQAAHKIVEENQANYFLYVRHFVAKKVRDDLLNNPKFEETESYRREDVLKEAGPMDASDYHTLKGFFGELTGAVHQSFDYYEEYLEYETYYFYYEKRITDYLFGFLPGLIINELPKEILTDYDTVTSEEFTVSKLRKLLANSFYLMVNDYMEQLQDEFITDLLELAEQPFNLEIHEQYLQRDINDRKRKEEEILAEIRRKQEEEERMLDDIFGREYIPSNGRSTRYVIHIGETNTGKTFQALQKMKEAKSGLYLAPLRLLALEVYDTLNSDGVPCSLKTGEEEKLSLGATHFSSTVEMFYEKDHYEVIVIDEAQMIADKDRGFSWYKAITKANADEVHIVGSFSMKEMVLQLLGNADIEINEYTRDTPLQVEDRPFTLRDTKRGDALVCFSRKRVLETASILQNNGHQVSMIYGSMPPETRKKQMQRFIDGETTVIVATDAIGMGLNLPIRRVVFLQNEKFDGTRRRRLTSQEVKQIAGRAGRKGMYEVGKVAFTGDIKAMEKLIGGKDRQVHTFAIAPTSSILERFQKYSNKLGHFFELWDKFESPAGTEKATLSEEQILYETIEDTIIEARLTVNDLYGFLHLPFSTKEQTLINQWQQTMEAIVTREELPEPFMNKDSLENVELSYKSIGLHLLFLYRLDRRTEATYWERIRESFSDEVHERLQTDVKMRTKQCTKCGKKLDPDFKYAVCDACHFSKLRKKHKNFTIKRPF
ncbi:RNA helicase [Sutcliffiella horikoshii]|uniref:RNA helicase n=1 Tax=Sutcliffiella horikoshii TaxID=79883 RepID=A0A5D4T4Y0_9BACI|nr:DEAD/DEAH box helicase [Sutcliffiella horikoshii]TYS70349.1 RNA helicase [Sutcliffiella horikoshii]